MKISFLSVFPPFRGGISKHSSLIYKYLLKKHEVQALNFSKLYPSIFFPGKTQYDSKVQTIGDRVLSSTNILSWNKTEKKIRKYNTYVFIIKFCHPFFIPCYNYIIKKVKKNINCKVVMICDNLFPHEYFPLSKFLIKQIIRNVDGFIVQSSIVEDELKSLLESPVYSKKYHPIYDGYEKGINMVEAKAKLSINESKVVLFFGLVRKYKGLDILIKSMNEVFKKVSDVKLLIAGECYGKKDEYLKLINESKFKNKIYWIEEFIPEKKIPILFSACDVVVLPYRTASQSGVIPLSYHYNKPVITSNIKSLVEVVDNGKTGHIYNSESDLKLTILDFFDKYDGQLYENSIKEYKKSLSWDSFIDGIEEVYLKLNETA